MTAMEDAIFAGELWKKKNTNRQLFWFCIDQETKKNIPGVSSTREGRNKIIFIL